MTEPLLVIMAQGASAELHVTGHFIDASPQVPALAMGLVLRPATMSPVQFQKRIRLQRARSLLAARPCDVASVGHLVGYDSPSQFNREYRRPFGAPPGQDAARLRADTDLKTPQSPHDLQHLP
jgi:Helix-turn-helix domain